MTCADDELHREHLGCSVGINGAVMESRTQSIGQNAHLRRRAGTNVPSSWFDTQSKHWIMNE